MKRYIAYTKICLCLLSMFSLSACNTETAETQSNQAAKPTVVATATAIPKATVTELATATGIPQEQTPSPNTSLTTITAQASTVAGTGELAPPYEEIRSTLIGMRGDPKLPITQEERTQIYDYQRSLSGKRFENWVGWTDAIHPPKELAEASDRTFTMYVDMDDPSTEKGRQFTEVTLPELTREQAGQFEAWSWNPDIHKYNRVVFSGTIYGVMDFGSIIAYASQVEPVK